MNWEEFNKLEQGNDWFDVSKSRTLFEKLEKDIITTLDYSHKNTIQFELQNADYFPVLTEEESDIFFMCFVYEEKTDYISIYYFSFHKQRMMTITRKRKNHFFQTLSKIKSKIRKEKIHKLCQYIC